MWSNLQESGEKLIQSAFIHVKLRTKKLWRWRRFSIWTFLLTLSIHLCWWVWTLQLNQSLKPGNSTLWTDDALLPLPVKMLNWHFDLIWSVFCLVNFTLSQQVLLILLILADILSSSIRAINEEIEGQVRKYRNPSIDLSSGKSSHQEDLEERCMCWKKRNAQNQDFYGLLNSSFSSLLFVSYGCDFLSAFGYAANILINFRPAVDSYAFYLSSSLLYFSYITLFLLPLLSVYEQVKKVSYQKLFRNGAYLVSFAESKCQLQSE
jgi:hypothetical protein